MRANLVGDPNLSNPSPGEWFNPSAFAVPAIYTFGNLGRNALRTDGSFNLDLSVFRDFPIRERMHLQFRAEAFNALNNVVYGTPDTNLGSPTFSHVFSTANTPRQLQFGLKLEF